MYDREVTTADRSVLRIRWIGHSTVLVELDGVRVLTDPVLRGRLAHLRRVTAGADARTLRSLDAVLVSHLHYDHLDVPSLGLLGRGLQLVVPAGGGKLLRKKGFANVTEVEVGDEVRVGAIGVRATHAVHAGRRLPLGAEAPPVGYVLEGSARVYFAGDTDLFDGMSTLAPDLDLALLPIGGWGHRVPAGHLNPRSAAEALRLLRPRVVIPIHWGTYRSIGLRRGASLLRAPADSFRTHAQELAPDVDVRLLRPGESVDLDLPPAQAGPRTSALKTGVRP